MKRILIAAALVAAPTIWAQQSTLSPRTAALLMERERAAANHDGSLITTFAVAEDETVQAFIRVDAGFNPALLEDAGVRLNGLYEDVYTATLPISSLREVSQIPGVNFVRVAENVNLLMDQARKATKANEANKVTDDNGTPFKGKGVVVGIVDTGLEFNHPAFRDAEGNNRLSRVWVQGRNGKSPAQFDYGAEYTRPEELSAAKYDTGEQYHATHVFNIAAGSVVTTPGAAQIGGTYNGLAPESEMVFVSFSDTDANIVDGVKYIFDYAESVGKPCVVNLSLGQHYGPHDGTSIVDKSLDALTGPGRIIVGACGNEAQSMMHVSKKFTADDKQLKTMLGYPSAQASKTTHIDIWGQEGTTLRVKFAVVDPLRGRIMHETDYYTSNDKDNYAYFRADTGADAIFTIMPMANSENGRPEIYIVSRCESLNDARKLAIIVEGEEGEEVHMWNVGGYDFINAGRPGWTAGTNAGTVCEIGGTARNVISVGSYNSRSWYPAWWTDPGIALDFSQQLDLENGKVSFFSSLGPTADGRVKPDVSAPGALIVSAVSKHCYTFDPSTSADRVWDEGTGEFYYYDVDVGTSMASPHVAGAVALWLQANPELTPDDVRDVIKRTAAHDSYTGTEANYKYGYGKINVYDGLMDVIRTTSAIGGIVGDQEEGDAGVWYDRSTQQLCVVAGTDARVMVYSASGQLVRDQRVPSGYSALDLAGVSSGVYIVKVVDGVATTTAKIIR